jgi:hypothetical protein
MCWMHNHPATQRERHVSLGQGGNVRVQYLEYYYTFAVRTLGVHRNDLMILDKKVYIFI